ncbi:MAG: hypothetical protein IPG48_17770 [Saprospiraceae bacterium]|nr:hypothetical protein [Saprospiraceae bacterium]
MNFGNDSLNYLNIVRDRRTSIVPTIKKIKDDNISHKQSDQISWKNENTEMDLLIVLFIEMEIS